MLTYDLIAFVPAAPGLTAQTVIALQHQLTPFMALNPGDYFDVANPTNAPKYRISFIRQDILHGPEGPHHHICRTTLSLTHV
nr:hypothetical protein [uncultured Dongia sp.]